MSESNIVKLEPGRADADLAADVRKRLTEAFKPALAIMDEAKAAGLIVGFNCGLDTFGRWSLLQIAINKPL